ncbi:MAG: acyl-CoA reductase-like NAD-dependent aldehyde dehydrogenase [Myxococcota bacterium]|jgi:acyl-CoA reductase-like NAD-dependent aldehyde dehydrogenase
MTEHFELAVAGGGTPVGRFEVCCPYDGSALGTVDTLGEALAEQAFAKAYECFRDRRRWLSIPQRLEILERTATIMQGQFEELALGAAAEGGKPLLDSRVEVARAIEGVQLCREALKGQSGTQVPMGVSAASAQRIAFSTREPIGVVMAISAFNHPLNLIVHQVGPALAAGCPVLIKPATATPLSCFRFVRILREAGLPDEWCQIAMTADNALASSMVADRRTGFFSFIGSAAVGWMLRSKLAPGARCALEHGGVAPVIVAADADLDEALPLLVKGGFYHAGQVCVSVQRIYAHRSIARELAERLGVAASQLKVGDPRLPDTEVGPLIQPQEVERVNDWVDEAVRGGAEVIAGGGRLPNQCFEPTVLFDPPADCTISRNEIFGPVVCVYPFDDMQDALDRANGLDVAFQAAVWTRDIDTAMRAYRGLDASAVMINDHTAFRVDWMPFAGLRHSGHGIGGIQHTLDEMQISKLAVLRSLSL